jgi:hypothetical protein
MPSRLSLLTALVCALSGWLVVRHGRQMLCDEITLADGGGWTALFLAEFRRLARGRLRGDRASLTVRGAYLSIDR